MRKKRESARGRVEDPEVIGRRNTCGKGAGEVCDFKRLEHVIEAKAQGAVKDVDRRLKVIGFCFSVAALFGIPYLASWYVEKVDQKVTERFVEGKLDDKIDAVVPGMIDGKIAEFDEKMSTSERRLDERLTRKVSLAEETFSTYRNELKCNLAEANDKLKLFGDIMAAQAGGREAYDKLNAIGALTNEQGRMARDAQKTIKDRYLFRKVSINNGLFYSLNLSPNMLEGLPKEYHWTNMAYGDCEWNSEGAIIELMRTRDRHNVATLVHVVEKSKYLNSVYTAICGLEQLTGEKFDPLGIEQVLSWWKRNRDKQDYYNGFERYFDHLENNVGPLMPNESPMQYAWRRVIALDAILREKPEFYPAALTLIPLAVYTKIDSSQQELRKKILLRAMVTIEKQKDFCPDWDVHKARVLMTSGDGADAVRFIHSRLKEDPTFKARLEIWPEYRGGFWRVYDEDVKSMGLSSGDKEGRR